MYLHFFLLSSPDYLSHSLFYLCHLDLSEGLLLSPIFPCYPLCQDNCPCVRNNLFHWLNSSALKAAGIHLLLLACPFLSHDIILPGLGTPVLMTLNAVKFLYLEKTSTVVPIPTQDATVAIFLYHCIGRWGRGEKRSGLSLPLFSHNLCLDDNRTETCLILLIAEKTNGNIWRAWKVLMWEHDMEKSLVQIATLPGYWRGFRCTKEVVMEKLRSLFFFLFFPYYATVLKRNTYAGLPNYRMLCGSWLQQGYVLSFEVKASKQC